MNKKRNDWAGILPAKPDPYVEFEQKMLRMFEGMHKLEKLSEDEVAEVREELISAKRAYVTGWQ